MKFTFLVLVLVLVLFAACTKSKVEYVNECLIYRPITWSEQDSEETIRQIIYSNYRFEKSCINFSR